MTQIAKLTPSDGLNYDAFGWSVAIHGDTIVAGINGKAVYVFVKPNPSWVDATQTAKLTDSGALISDDFGDGLAVSADTIVVGAPLSASGCCSHQGKAYVYVKPGAAWANSSTPNATLEGTFTGFMGGTNATVGLWDAIDGNTIAVSAIGGAYIGNGVHQGVVFVFTRPNAGWSGDLHTQDIVTFPSGISGSGFGTSIALQNGVLLSGVPQANIGAHTGQGTVYVQTYFNLQIFLPMISKH
jgi:hypothetical protein